MISNITNIMRKVTNSHQEKRRIKNRAMRKPSINEILEKTSHPELLVHEVSQGLKKIIFNKAYQRF